MREGQVCTLGGRAFDVLQVLLDNHDRVVTGEEILDRVWPGLAIEPNNLQVQIWALRKLLGPGMIVNVPRRGYRYIGPPPQRRVAVQTAGEAGVASWTGTGETVRSRLRWQSRPT